MVVDVAVFLQAGMYWLRGTWECPCQGSREVECYSWYLSATVDVNHSTLALSRFSNYRDCSMLDVLQLPSTTLAKSCWP